MSILTQNPRPDLVDRSLDATAFNAGVDAAREAGEVIIMREWLRHDIISQQFNRNRNPRRPL